jgi:hypothetical protein
VKACCAGGLSAGEADAAGEREPVGVDAGLLGGAVHQGADGMVDQ